MLINCADAQTGLRLLCSQTPEYRFSRVVIVEAQIGKSIYCANQFALIRY